jgi:hypothetical protein
VLGEFAGIGNTAGIGHLLSLGARMRGLVLETVAVTGVGGGAACGWSIC